MFEKGDKVRLSEHALNSLYPATGQSQYRNKMAAKEFIVVGYSRDKQCTRVIPAGGSPKSQSSYHNSFLEMVSRGKGMTLVEAIETNESIKHVCRTLFPPKEQAALSLGIEALKRLAEARTGITLSPYVLLPGETEE